MKIRKKIICILMTATQAQATPILVSGEGTKTSDFDRFATQQQGSQTFVQMLLAEPQNKAAQSQIREKFIDAKASLLKGEYEKSKAVFLEIIGDAYNTDWPSQQRALITHSFLSLAEMSSVPSEKKYWVTKAVGFSLGEIPEIQTLSKNVQDLIRETLKSARSFDVSLKILNEWDLILLNGREVKATELQSLKILSENYRITFLSNQFQPRSEIFHSNQISKIAPTRESIVAGSCENPQLMTSPGNKIYRVLFPEGCEREWNKNWVVKIQNRFLPSYNLAQSDSELSEKPSLPSSSKWLWGTALVAGIALILVNQNSRTENQPQRTEDAED